MSAPEVSVCVPVYNGASYLEKCLDSVAAQAGARFEVLLVDDGSSDDSFALCQAYARRDARFRALRNDVNLGLVGNWNRSIELARGEWLKFVFQDDWIAPGCLEQLLQAAGPATQLVACSRAFEFEPGTAADVQREYLRNRERIESLWGAAPRDVPAPELAEAALRFVGANLIGEPTSVMVRRGVFERFGPFNADLIMSCDLEYWLRVGVNAGFTWLPERLATFRVHGGATSAENRESRSYRMNALDDLIVLHEFAHAEAYAPLRAQAARHEPALDLMQLFTAKAAWAARTARQDATPNGRYALQAEWDAVAARYPRIAAAGRAEPVGLRGRLAALTNAWRRTA